MTEPAASFSPARDAAAGRALREATLARLRHTIASLGRPVRIQLVLAAIGLPALLADHAQRFYTAGGPMQEPLLPWIVRVTSVLVFLLGLLLARVARGIALDAPDERFLAVTPVSPRVRHELRTFQLALAMLPMVWLGTGGILPLLWNGDAGLFVRALALWLTWSAFTCAWVGFAVAMSPAPGRGQALYEVVAGVIPALVFIGARLAGGVIWPLESRDSLWVTAGIGALLALGVWWAAARWPALERRRERALAAWRGRGSGGRREVRAGRAKAFPRFGHGAVAIARSRHLWALRSPASGGPLLAGIALKVIGVVTVLEPPSTGEPPPYGLVGLLVLLGDALIGGAILTLMEHERRHLYFGLPVSRAARWWGTGGPALVLSALTALLLAGLALASPHGGARTAGFILAWCGLAGGSLIAQATNLALASYPNVGVAQNLYWVGLLVCLILSAVIPLFGWVILVAFALYSFRELRHWGPA